MKKLTEDFQLPYARQLLAYFRKTYFSSRTEAATNLRRNFQMQDFYKILKIESFGVGPFTGLKKHIL